LPVDNFEKMNSRRDFLRGLGVLGAVTALPKLDAAESTNALPVSTGATDREYWMGKLQHVVWTVIGNLAMGKLREKMPVEALPNNLAERRKVTHLEAIGRTLSGTAPWLELAGKSEKADGMSVIEAAATQKLAELARQGLANATDPKSPDFIDFTAGGQCLVDAAFLSHALLRSPNELYSKLPKAVQQRLVASLKSTRKFKPGQNNWVLFSAMIETFLASVGEEWQSAPVDTALRDLEQWYKGDGAYGDGPEFHWDYYNSYVMQPFLIDVVEHISKVTDQWNGLREGILRRARRYAAVQERMIAPDGSYPVLGRSIAYRCGAFQLLAQMALRNELPEGVSPPQVRCALTAVIRCTLGAPDTFDENGWLRVGLAGHQPELAESYISTGSLYLCTFAFLPLGLPASHPFWTGPAEKWTSQKAWSGKNLPADHALSEK
jgi:hypothetical protein